MLEGLWPKCCSLNELSGWCRGFFCTFQFLRALQIDFFLGVSMWYQTGAHIYRHLNTCKLAHRRAKGFSPSVSRSVRVNRWSAQIFPFQFLPVEQLFLHAICRGSALITLNHNTAAREKKRWKTKKSYRKTWQLKMSWPWVCCCLVGQKEKVHELVKSEI